MRLNWPTAGWLTFLHVLAIAGLVSWSVTFTWSGFWISFGLFWSTVFGVTVGFHRLFTHRSFKAYWPVRLLFGVLGTLSGQGSILQWVPNHHVHHGHSDHEGDPHNSKKGFLWCHLLWMFYTRESACDTAKEYTYLSRDWVAIILSKMFWPLNVGLTILLAWLGWYLGGYTLALSWVCWGVFIRMVAGMHATWLINSGTHMWGYRNYKTDDESRNNLLISILTAGEGNHNNHHRHPNLARHGHRWFEWDPSWRVIQLLGFLHLAWDIKDGKNVNGVIQ